MKPKYKILLLLLVIGLVPNLKVSAKTVQSKICCDNAGLYSIMYDDSVNTEVSLGSINCSNVASGHLNYPNGVEDQRFKFTSSRVASVCNNSGGTISTCPKDTNALSKIKSSYIKDDASLTSNLQIDFNGSGKFNIKIKDVYNGAYKIRYTQGDNNRNTSLANASNYSDFMVSNGGYFYLYGIDPDTSIGLEFYQQGKGDGCDGAFIGGIVFFTPDLSSVEIPNPALTDPTYGCAAFKGWVPSNLSAKNYDKTQFSNLKKEVVRQCYDSVIKYSELADLHNVTLSNINAFKTLFSGINVLPAGGGNKCTNTRTLDSKVTSWSGSYWAYSCTENYEATGDQPKLVRAGSGFEYESTFRVTRSCKKIKINESKHYTPSYCPIPIYCEKCSCDCSWTGASGAEHTGSEAGPNDQFDQCVKQCDGGKYSQKCINSCYQDVYQKNRDFSFSSNFTLDTREKTTQFVADYSAQDAAAGGLVTTSSGYTSHNLPGVVYTMTIAGRESCSCTESYWCQGGHGSCTFHTWLEPCGVDVAYCGKVEARANAESSYVDAAIDENINIDTSKFGMTITDSYLNDGTYQITYTTSTQPALNVEIVKDTNTEAIVKVSLPLSYINKITSWATYKSNESASTGYRMNAGKALLEAVAFSNTPNDLAEYYFTKGERKYYTNINSKNLNVGFDSAGNVGLRNDKYNIVVSSGTNGDGAMGWGKFGSTIDCYYGVYNDFYIDQDVCNPLIDICDGGLQYIFRPIVLSDVFPNGRNPRYNWSSKSIGRGNEIYGTKVDPVGYTKTIQTKQDTIYNKGSGEVDYEFILTPKSIAAIKAYNRSVEDFNKDGAKNYLDYDMSCYRKNGRDVCTNRFLDRTDILIYGSGYTVDQRKSIAECNNARDNGTACDTGAHD